MRTLVALAAAVVCVGACAEPPLPAPATTTALPTATAVNPARVDRVRTDLPPGYEVADLAGGPAPVTLWGFGPGAAAAPPPCGSLADPAVDPASVRGWSASGPGGIAHAVVASGAAPPDPALPGACGQWTLTSGRADGAVTRVDAPAVDGAVTVGLAADVVTTVEGGTATRSHADTFLAYFEGYVAAITVVTDPGAPQPPLPAAFAANLLAKTVSALRGPAPGGG